MDYPIIQMSVEECSSLLLEIPQPPEKIYVRGNLAPRGTKCLAVVGSRDYTNYGKQVVEYLIQGLQGYPISIISGLALGIDALAHHAALNASLHTLAIPGSGIDDTVLYPRKNFGLAKEILSHGGGLLSEFEPTFRATQWSFPQRNRIMAGLAHAVLLIEAGEKSGTLITARMTCDYNRELLVVPGNIFSENSKGSHQFLKLGATPVTSPEDILEALNITVETKPIPFLPTMNPDEQMILEFLSEPKDHDSLIRLVSGNPEETLILIMRMQLAGHIKEENGQLFKTK